MPVISQPPVLISPGGFRVSQPTTIPARSKDFKIQLTDTGDYYTLVGNILIWGWMISRDNGATWDWQHYQPGRADPDTFEIDGLVMPFGVYPGKPSRLITNVTNQATPTVTLDRPHDYKAGEKVRITGVLGATGLNGIRTVLSQGLTTTAFRVSLGAQPGAYQSGGFVEVQRLPFLAESGADVVVEAGNLARLAIAVDTAITLGVDITAN